MQKKNASRKNVEPLAFQKKKLAEKTKTLAKKKNTVQKQIRN